MAEQKPKLKVVVSMHGGAIDDVSHNRPDLGEIEIIFLEDPKYVEDEYDDNGEPLFEVPDGIFKGRAVWASCTTVADSPENLDPVFKTADRRDRGDPPESTLQQAKGV
jgi:hypothetical protein